MKSLKMDDRPRILAALPGLIPSTIIGVVKPLLQLHKAGKIEFSVTFENLARRHHLERTQLLVLCRNTEPEFGHLIDWAFELGKPVIYELDDNLLETPAGSLSSRYFNTPKRRAQLEKYLRRADLIRVYAPAMQAYLADYNPNIVLVNGPLDWTLVPEKFPRRDPRRVRIIYATSRVEDEVGPMLVRVVRRILNTFPQTEFTMWGSRLDSLLGQPRVQHLGLIMDYDRFFRKFARRGFDIGLAPLPDDLFHRCKSNNKFREYAACRIAGVYSNTEVYRGCVENGVTGFLVEPNNEAWFQAISGLVTETSLRERIQEQAQGFARQNYSQERMQADWMANIEQVLSNRSEPAASASSNSLISPDRCAIARAIVEQTLHTGSYIMARVREKGLIKVLGNIRLYLNVLRQFITLKVFLWRGKYLKLRHHSRG